MATIAERRRRMKRPSFSTEDLFEALGPAQADERVELLFEQAAMEIDTGRSKRGVYAMALTDADGDQDRAQAGYMRRRVNQLEAEYDNWELEKVEADKKALLLEEASADMRRALFALAMLVVAIVAIVNWT